MNVYRVLVVLCVSLAGLVVQQVPASASVVDGGVVTPTGPGVEVTFVEPDQSAQVSFEGATGVRYSLGFTQTTLDGIYYVSIIRPDGTTQVSAAPLIGANAELDIAALSQSGTYTAVIDPSGTSTGATTVTLSTEIAGGVLDPTGLAVPTTIERPGQNVGFQFTGATGQRFSLGFTQTTLDGIYYVTVIRPDSTTHVSAQPLIGQNAELDLPVLTQNGSYRVVIDPTAPGTGGITTTLSMEIAGGVLDPTGAPASVAVDRPGQNVGFQFDGVTGQRFSLGFTGVTLEGIFYVTVVRPDGTTHVSAAPLIGQNAELDLPVLTQNGTYRVVIDPTAPGTGAVTTTLSTEITGGTLDPTGPAVSATIDRPGQNIGFQFTATAGDRFGLGFTDVTLNGIFYVSVVRPDGTTQVNAQALIGQNAELDLPALTQNGTYRVVIDPTAPGTGAVTTTLSRDLAAGTLTVDGASLNAAIDRPGQNARFAFNGTTGQRLTLGLTAVTLDGIYYVTVIRPDGTTHTTRTLIGDATISIPTLTATGSYQVTIDPDSAATGSITASLTTTL